MKKILQIGNYPPPMCGWAMQTFHVTNELRRRGHLCEVMNINENRRLKNQGCIDVQNGCDYLRKVWRYASDGYSINVHLNGMSRKGYLLALTALMVARIRSSGSVLTFHGGLNQMYFPREAGTTRWLFRELFQLAAAISCDSVEIKRAIEGYGIDESRIVSIPTFSSQYLEFVPATLPQEVEDFLGSHTPVIFSYMSFRSEYELDIVRDAMNRFLSKYPRAGFIWAGFPAKEMTAVEAFVRSWPAGERNHLLLLGNLQHDLFLTLVSRCSITLRTPACDGVAASVLESLALGVSVVASENGRRPAGVITYQAGSSSDMSAKLVYVTEHREGLRMSAPILDDNVARMADWLLGELLSSSEPLAAARHPT